MKDLKHIKKFNESVDTIDSDLKKVYVLSDQSQQVMGVVSDFKNQDLVKMVVQKEFSQKIEITYNEEYGYYEVTAVDPDRFDPYIINIESVCYFI